MGIVWPFRLMSDCDTDTGVDDNVSHECSHGSPMTTSTTTKATAMILPTPLHPTAPTTTA